MQYAAFFSFHSEAGAVSRNEICMRVQAEPIAARSEELLLQEVSEFCKRIKVPEY